MATEFDAADVKLADVVVTGAIENYKVVLDPNAREDRRALLDGLPADFDPEEREWLESQDSFTTDYARFDILVEEVLLGTSPDRISVVWISLTSGVPKQMPTGSYLVALVAPTSSLHPLRRPNAAILPRPDAFSLSVLDLGCGLSLIFPVDSTAVADIRTIISKE